MQRIRFILITSAAAIALTSSAFASDLPDLFDSPWVGFDSSDFSTARYVYAGTMADFDNDGDPDDLAVLLSNFGTQRPDSVPPIAAVGTNAGGQDPTRCNLETTARCELAQTIFRAPVTRCTI